LIKAGVSKKKISIPSADSEAAFPIETESHIDIQPTQNNNNRYALDPCEISLDIQSQRSQLH
jgi:hypothetical protein